jgi:hypothetical protein
MKHLSYLRAVLRFRLRLASVRGMLAGGIFLSLALVVAGLFLFLPTISTSVPPARAGQAAVTSPYQIRPRRTPRPTPPPTPTPRPTSTPTVAPSPTALPTETATAAGTLDSSAQAGDASGSGKEDAQADGVSPGTLLGWGLGALAVGVFGTFILLFTRRTARAEQQLPFAPPTKKPTQARLNQLYRLLPARQATLSSAAERAEPEPLPEADHDWEPLPPLQETSTMSPLKPPRWLIEAGLLKADSGEWPAADQQRPGRERNASTDEP